jgi:hypothetical protein
VAAAAGAASATPNTMASMLDLIHDVPCIMRLLCMKRL